MHFPVALVASVVALAAVVAETPCPGDEIVKLTALATNPNIPTCQANAGGFMLVPPSGLPTPEQNAKMCATPACHDLIKAVIAINPTDCLLTIGSVSLNVYKLANGFEDSCKSTTTQPPPGPTPTSSGPTPTPTSTSTPGPTSPSPSPTTKPAC